MHSAQAPISSLPKKRRLRSGSARKTQAAILFLLPGVVFTLIFRYYTMASSFWLSLHRYDVVNPPGEFVGFENYRTLLANPDFRQSWQVTLLFLIFVYLLNFWVPIVQAIFLSETRIGRGVFSSLYLIPTVVPTMANVIIWKFIFHPVYGLANRLLDTFGLPPQTWYSDPRLTVFCIVFPGIVGGGFAVLMYLSAIQGVSSEIIEAAKVDGCSSIKRLIYITLPNIKFLIVIQLILTSIGTLQILDPVIQYTMGGPSFASTSVAFLIYDRMQVRFDYGQATAIAFMLQLAIAILTILQLRLDRSEKE